MRWLICGVLLSALVASGCTQQPAQTQPTVRFDPNRKPPKPPEPPPPPDPGPQPPYPRGGGMQLKSDPVGGPARVVETDRVPAAVGVGAKGRRLEDPQLVQPVVTPAIAYFRTQERVIFEISIPKALQLYEAQEGRKPRSHEEFVRQVLEPNAIRLPELPADHRYIYDPQSGELMVERPAQPR